jgi:hypothetical protein
VVDSDCPGHDDHCTPVTCEHLPAGGEGGGAADGGVKLVATCVSGTPVVCTSSESCTQGTCDPATGACAFTHQTPDLDGDGYYAPLPGYAPGSPGSCGDDCDDTNPDAHPGGTEICDGVDNDCDGIVDNGATYPPDSSAPQVQVSGPIAPASPGGLGWSFRTQSYAATYTGDDNGFSVYLSTLNRLGGVITPPGEQVYTRINADASGGAISWRGDRYGMVWQDRRAGNYDIYFSAVASDGTKQISDIQVSTGTDFSVNPTIVWNNLQFLVVWQDDRNGPFDVFAQRINLDLTLDGGNMQLTFGNSEFGSESPSIAPGLKGAGLACAYGDATHHWIDFQVFTPDLTKALTPPIHVTDGTTEAEYPMVVWSRDRYVVGWYDNTASPKAVYAATFLEDGTPLSPPTAITSPGPAQSRYPWLKALGDRVLVLYSDDRDMNDGYELYTRMVRSDLTPLGGEMRITHATGDSIFPVGAFGQDGDYGVLFRDDRLGGVQNIFFTALTCDWPGGG